MSMLAKMESAAQRPSKLERYCVIGLDIGTTSLCAMAVDVRDGSVLRTLVRSNQAALTAEVPDERLQDPERIVDELLAMLGEWRDLFPETAAIGISAQMHGILYVDADGRAVSPLYTWQDGRGDRTLPDVNGRELGESGTEREVRLDEGRCGGEAGETGRADGADDEEGEARTYRQQLEALTGYPVPSGYGLLTHDVLRRTGAVPPAAAKLCTIGDYAAMRLASRTAPLTDATQAAGLGLFDLRSRSFDLAAAACAGIEAALLPALAGAVRALVGATPDGIPVAAAIGDNQASYLGAVPALAGSLLFNVGTGAQLSLYSPEPAEAPGLELRPFPGGGWLLSGASLGGGKTYALLAAFYREIAETLGGLFADERPPERGDAPPAGTVDGSDAPPGAARPALPADRLYAAMNRWALAALDEGRPLPKVDPAFFGTRAEPGRTASIAGLTPQTLTPQALTAGLLAGVAEELAAFAGQLPSDLRAGVRRRVGAGNGIRRNPALRRLLEERLGAPLELAEEREEAAFGAAVHAAVCAGIFTDYDEALARMGGNCLTEGDIV